MSRLKKGDKVIGLVEDEFTTKGIETEVIAVPGDPEYDEQQFTLPDEGFIHKPYPGKIIGGRGPDWVWNFQEDFRKVEE